jgi:Protein of unknown function (DUF3574)
MDHQGEVGGWVKSGWAPRAMKILPRSAPAIIIALALTGEAGAQLVDCRAGQKPTQVAELMFGRNIGDRIGVGEAEWSDFVDREITPRFPDGLTIFDAASQWRDKAGNKIVREPSKIVQIVLPGNVEDIARLNEIAEAYKTRFQQQSVGVIVRPACVSF